MTNRLKDEGLPSRLNLPIDLRRDSAEQERRSIDTAFESIDTAFEGMADDAEYRAEAELIAREFAQADWEAFQRRDERVVVRRRGERGE